MDVFQEGGPLWTHFSIQAKCNLCEESVRIEWGVFSVLVTHLKVYHSSAFGSVSADAENKEDDISDFEPKYKSSVDELLDIENCSTEDKSEPTSNPVVIKLSKPLDNSLAVLPNHFRLKMFKKGTTLQTFFQRNRD